MMKKIVFLLGAVALMSFGCNKNPFKSNSSDTAQVGPAFLTLDSLKNASYKFVFKDLADVYNKESLKLTNGIYYFALPIGAERSEYLTKLDEKNTAFGDIDGNGKGDAAAVLTGMAGKDRTFEALVVLLNKNGSAEYAAGTELEKGVSVESLSIKDGKVEVTEKAGDGTETKTVKYRVENDSLVQE